MQIGDLFDGRYFIRQILGRGGMGTVFLSQNIHTGTLWAIKEIPGNGNPEFDLLAEPNLLKKLEHPALPRLFDILEQDGNLYMVSDYIEGIPLDRKLEDEGRIPEETVINWAIQLCDALDYLHTLAPNPIIYRDMKPSNIILTNSGKLKLIDFGIAREYKPKSDGDTVFIGTRGYAAPEQFGTGQTSACSDIYSLGVTLHHLLTGKSPLEPPYGLRPIRQLNGALSAEIEGIVGKCIRDNPMERYQSASLLQTDLRNLWRLNGKESDKIYMEHPAGRGISEDTPDRNSAFSPQKAISGKQVITIWDNAEFGCEFAYMAAKYSTGDVLLADLDLLAPKADLFLNLNKYPANTPQSGLHGYSGLDAVMDALDKGVLDEELFKKSAAKRKELKNLYILTGNFRLENYEYFRVENISKLIEKSCRYFDLTIFLVNRSVYDGFTLAALIGSDLNIAAVRGEVDQLREYNSYIRFLEENQHLPIHHTRFVLFEYDNTFNMPVKEAREAVQDNLLGAVSHSRRRLLYRNLCDAYAACMEKGMEQEYERLFAKMGLLREIKRKRGFRSAGRIMFGKKTDEFDHVLEE